MSQPVRAARNSRNWATGAADTAAMDASRESIETFGAELVQRRAIPWQWSYAWWSGYWYGPVPVGALAGIAAGLAIGAVLLRLAGM